jgi:methionine-rich copper-binding protein CopC
LRNQNNAATSVTTQCPHSSKQTLEITMIVRHTIIVTLASAALSVAAASAALAHAHLVRATPAEGGKLKDAPAEVALKFSERLEPSFSSAVIRDSAGKQVDKADAHVDKADRTVVRVSLPALEPGVYTVEWRVMSSDTHKVSGNFTFRVGE